MKRISLRAQGPKPRGPVCQLCQFSTSGSRTLPIARLSTPASRLSNSNPPLQSRHSIQSSFSSPVLLTRRYASKHSTPDSTIQQVAEEASALQTSDQVPSNEAVVEVLAKCQKIAEALVSRENDGASLNDEGNAISSLLDMEEKKRASAPAEKRTHQARTAKLDSPHADSISRIANDLLTDKKVFISPEALEHYTKIQTLLRRAEHFPEIFNLYANKPVPEANSSPIKYLKPKPKSINSAVPSELATMALDVAIAQKNLPLVLAIIDNTFCAPAFHRAKVFRKAGIPLAGLASAPLACYAAATWAASVQNTMDPSTATGIAFAASLAYVGGTSSMGILAITSANDQMERVTWLPGVPLRHRWLREEERAALDKVACTWGFKDPYMRGEEVGEEWESLREFIGMRGMILDKTELMAGME
ncbi:uncharacterized protein N7498_005379 [Penicillium cinerascens]|uniref:Uncharacterized protein n=1 Tax=Penicillium cinerascens TaxID=70096 RepID=A0A9W9T0I3_9EURO|nr:uncharacterized protein N7498_005379 [Penicillium cinerascens]KAJ5204500.1 hypothetical protein N7498_005379 [Penicillium cinerascens]